MKKLNPVHILVSILSISIFGCSPSTPGVVFAPTTDVNTMIADTAAAAMKQTALVQPPPVMTFTSTMTLTITPTVTLFFPITPELPDITVSVATNCRSGPGKVYGYEGALLIGETAKVYARDLSSEYWYIRNPDSTGAEYCWVLGKYATVTGNSGNLPMFTPPPTPTITIIPTITGTPTASFNLFYSGLDTCSSNWWVDIKIRNDGTVTFKSLDLVIRDTVTNISLEAAANGFKDNDGCDKTSTKETLVSGDTNILSAPAFTYDPTGHPLKVALILCTEASQKGECHKRVFDIDL